MLFPFSQKNKSIEVSSLLVGIAFMVLISMAFMSKCQAQNYFKLQGTEIFYKPKPIRIFGFLQPAYFYSTDGGDARQNFRNNDFNLRRARLGVRGVIPGTDDNINYLVLTEFGRNGVTQNANGDQGNLAALVFASVTLNYIPGVRLRVGQIRKPQGQEGLITANARNYVEVSDVYSQLLLERFGRNRSVGAFNDIGIEAFNWWQFGTNKQYEFEYSLMINNGNGINAQDNDANKGINAKVVFSRIFDQSKGIHRQNIQAGIWTEQGKRTAFRFIQGPANGSETQVDLSRIGTDLVFRKDLGVCRTKWL